MSDYGGTETEEAGPYTGRAWQSLCSPISRWESHLEMFASTQDLEFVQGQSRDVPDRELVLNMTITN